MKGLHLLTIGDFVFVFKHLNGEKVMQLVATQRLLKPWQPEIQEMYTSLQALPKGIDGADANPDDAAEAEAEARRMMWRRRGQILMTSTARQRRAFGR